MAAVKILFMRRGIRSPQKCENQKRKEKSDPNVTVTTEKKERFDGQFIFV